MKTLADYIAAQHQIINDHMAGRCTWGARGRAEKMLSYLAGLRDEVGGDYAGSYSIVRTEFHGGGVVSRHRSPVAAVNALVKHIGDTDCTCGCAGIVADVDALKRHQEPDADGSTPSPYALTL